MTHPVFARIDEFFARYQATFEQLDPDAIATFWFAPTLALEPGQVRVCVDETALQLAFETATGSLRQAGLQRADYELREVRVLRADLVDCVVYWHLRSASGALLKTLHNVYVLRADARGWGVAAVYLLPADQIIERLSG